MALWRGGAVARWRGGAVALWLEHRTLNREIPVSNPIAAVWNLGNFSHSMLFQFTQLYTNNEYLAMETGGYVNV